MRRRYLHETGDLSVSYLGKSTEKKFSKFDWYKNEIVGRSMLSAWKGCRDRRLLRVDGWGLPINFNAVVTTGKGPAPTCLTFGRELVFVLDIVGVDDDASRSGTEMHCGWSVVADLGRIERRRQIFVLVGTGDSKGLPAYRLCSSDADLEVESLQINRPGRPQREPLHPSAVSRSAMISAGSSMPTDRRKTPSPAQAR